MYLDMNLPVVAFTLFALPRCRRTDPGHAGVPRENRFPDGQRRGYVDETGLRALTALVWAGGLTDALGGLPLFCTFGFLLTLYGVVRLLQRVRFEATLVQGARLPGAWPGADGF